MIPGVREHEQLALLRSNLAIRETDADLPARLGAAYEAFEYLIAALESGPSFAASVMAATHAADGRGALGLAPSLLPIYEALPNLYTPTDAEPSVSN